MADTIWGDVLPSELTNPTSNTNSVVWSGTIPGLNITNTIYAPGGSQADALGMFSYNSSGQLVPQTFSYNGNEYKYNDLFGGGGSHYQPAEYQSGPEGGWNQSDWNAANPGSHGYWTISDQGQNLNTLTYGMPKATGRNQLGIPNSGYTYSDTTGQFDPSWFGTDGYHYGGDAFSSFLNGFLPIASVIAPAVLGPALGLESLGSTPGQIMTDTGLESLGSAVPESLASSSTGGLSDLYSNPLSQSTSNSFITPDVQNAAQSYGIDMGNTAGDLVTGDASVMSPDLSGQSTSSLLGGGDSLGKLGSGTYGLDNVTSSTGYNLGSGLNGPSYGVTGATAGSTGIGDIFKSGVDKFMQSPITNGLKLGGGLLGALNKVSQANKLKDLYKSQLDRSNFYNQTLQNNYTNPSSYLQSPEYQSAASLYANQIARQDAAAGRRSQYGARANQMQQFALANLDKYRRTLMQALGNPNDAIKGYGQSLNGPLNASGYLMGALQDIFGSK